MREPVTLFDIGQMNIRKDLKERNFQTNDCKQSFSNILFNWEHSEFILILRFNCSILDIDLLKTNCKTAIGKVRGFFGVDKKTGKLLGAVRGAVHGASNHFSGRFGHLGFKGSNEPKDIFKNIDHMLRIKVSFDKHDIMVQGIVECEGRLLSSSVLFKE